MVRTIEYDYFGVSFVVFEHYCFLGEQQHHAFHRYQFRFSNLSKVSFLSPLKLLEDPNFVADYKYGVRIIASLWNL